MHTLICQSCNNPFPAKRSDALTCGKRCRQRRLRGYVEIQAIPAAPRKLELTSDQVIRVDDPRFVRPSHPLTPADYDEVKWCLEEADNWFQNFGTEPTSAFDITADSATDPMTVELVDLLIEKLQLRDDLAYLGKKYQDIEHAFVYNKPV